LSAPRTPASAQLALADAVRRAQGEALAAFGFGPRECEHDIVATGPGWRLRAYGDGSSRPLLIVPAPIKRAYVWDLAPAVSVVRRLLDHHLGVHLLEWAPPARSAERADLDAHVEAIGAGLAVVAQKSGDAAPILIGHSLGGTLAAIFAADGPNGPGGLVLLGSPLCFGEGVSAFRDVLVSMIGASLGAETPVPGSMLTLASALASPQTFVWSRLADLFASLADPQALEVHLRVARWGLDEAPLPGRLMDQILDWLYREDRFYRGTLPLKGRRVGPRDLKTPTLAVVDAADEIAPLSAVKPFLDAAPAASRLIGYSGETGVGLQHLALLVGRRAHSEVWPDIMSWIDARR
jgi:polyhydroxyalkanoate synthase